MPNDDDTKLGKAIRKHLEVHPEATVQELAVETEAPESDVARVLDEYVPKGKADAEHVGPGKGGGWVDA